MSAYLSPKSDGCRNAECYADPAVEAQCGLPHFLINDPVELARIARVFRAAMARRLAREADSRGPE